MSSVEAVVSAAERVLAAQPSAFITDIDGTISRIVPRPEDAKVSAVAKQALEVLRPRLDLVAVITGREESVARRLVGVDGLTYVGHYGLDAESLGELRGDELDEAKRIVQPLLEGLDGVTFEEKGVSFSLHYRHSPDRPAMRRRLLEIAEPLAREAGGRLLEGKQVIEIVPHGLPDKGTAVRRLLEARQIKGALYFGDDISDVAVFRELKRQRETEARETLSVAVVDEETDDSVRETADLILQGVDELEDVFVSLARVTSGVRDEQAG